MPQESEAAFLRRLINEQMRRDKRGPKRGTPERRCNALCRRTGLRCKAPKHRWPDGRMAKRCRMHGGGYFDPKAEIARYKGLLRGTALSARTIRTKLAALRKAHPDEFRDHTYMVTYGHCAKCAKPLGVCAGYCIACIRHWPGWSEGPATSPSSYGVLNKP